MKTPIDEAVDANPTPAVILLSAASRPDYDPAQDDTQAQPVQFPVVGSFNGVAQTGIATDYQATFTLRAVDMPDGVKAGASRVQINGTGYVVKDIATRRWDGKVDGYTMHLVA